MKLTFLLFLFLNLVARSIASKGKSDVKESTDSSTTIDDDEKGTYATTNIFSKQVKYFKCVFLTLGLYVYSSQY